MWGTHRISTSHQFSRPFYHGLNEFLLPYVTTYAIFNTVEVHDVSIDLVFGCLRTEPNIVLSADKHEYYPSQP